MYMTTKLDPLLKIKARKLRKSGFSYKEIAQNLGIAKYWCDDIRLKPEHFARLYNKQVLMLAKGLRSSHERRIGKIKEIVAGAKNEIRLPIDNLSYKLFGAALYWAEGNKTKMLALTNSDPHLIKFAVCWFNDILDISPKKLKANLNIYAGQNERQLKLFWSELTGIPSENFGKSFIKPIGKRFKKNTLYYGTIRVRALKGTDLRHKIFGWIEAVLNDKKAEVEKVERKWHKLKEYKRP